ncbi:uncharacterized protein LACBIDRAFT_322495 [Laccaria bicolor S238N-H82]|uniref:Predicted protein n=1 Tax=Laccaria bicolor (strain S238N-H82 / ATCC MYA-4686) TaxID=486041 RepID=B0CWH6_LACBS|nr:uncharacterized protein LACBIDRAFT_322495 [Laccaria bicolor S238N-H82]EDR13509.1 predicted protein [Laccaria bicolor S238N-H82]|eukprot:XP_001876007.1 predicted protein [Laccaria bicolor S238N-H82]
MELIDWARVRFFECQFACCSDEQAAEASHAHHRFALNTLTCLLPELMQSLMDATHGLRRINSPKTTNISPPAPNAPHPDPLTLIAPFVIKALVTVYPSLLAIAVEAALAICAAMGAIPHTPPSTTN